MRNEIKVKSLTVLNGASVSNSLSRAMLGYADVVNIVGPASLDARTWTLEGSMDDITFYTIVKSDGTTALETPIAAKIRQYLNGELRGIPFIRLKGSDVTAADREWLVSIEEYDGGI